MEGRIDDSGGVVDMCESIGRNLFGRIRHTVPKGPSVKVYGYRWIRRAVKQLSLDNIRFGGGEQFLQWQLEQMSMCDLRDDEAASPHEGGVVSVHWLPQVVPQKSGPVPQKPA
jgi:hypothetical protein